MLLKWFRPIPLFWLLALFSLSQLVQAHGMSEADKQAIIEGGNLVYMWLGATHMLTGYDHLLFVFGIIFFLDSFRDIAKYITAFTVGHSVTLIYATFNAIQMNYFLIDAVIGLSVCYIAFANIDGFRKYLGLRSPNMLMMITGLGLIHGFGLSTRLQQLPLSEDNLLFNIVSFNVGVELGQIVALTLMLGVMALWRKRPSFQPFSLAANYVLIVAGGLLFLMQMHGYEHTSNSEELEPALPTMASVSNAAPLLPDEPWRDTVSIVIPGRGDKEYKLLLKEGQVFDFIWTTDGADLYFDFHAEPTGDTSGYFETFEKGTDRRSSGSLKATFSGTHGWYWKNDSKEAVSVELKVRGDYRRLDRFGINPLQN